MVSAAVRYFSGTPRSARSAAASIEGCAASVDRGPTRRSTKGTGLSVSLATRPHHAAMVWYDGERLAHVKFEGCPRAETGVFGGSCDTLNGGSSMSSPQQRRRYTVAVEDISDQARFGVAGELTRRESTRHITGRRTTAENGGLVQLVKLVQLVLLVLVVQLVQLV